MQLLEQTMYETQANFKHCQHVNTMMQAGRTETPYNIFRYDLLQDLSCDHAGKSDLDPYQKGIGINPYLLMKPMNFGFAESNARGCIAYEKGGEESKVIESMHIDADPVEPTASSGSDINSGISSSITSSGRRLLRNTNNPGAAVNRIVGSVTSSRSIPTGPQMPPPAQTLPLSVENGKRVGFSLPQGPSTGPKSHLGDGTPGRRQSPIIAEPLGPSENPHMSSGQRLDNPMSATQRTQTPKAVLGPQKTIAEPLNDIVRSPI